MCVSRQRRCRPHTTYYGPSFCERVRLFAPSPVQSHFPCIGYSGKCNPPYILLRSWFIGPVIQPRQPLPNGSTQRKLKTFTARNVSVLERALLVFHHGHPFFFWFNIAVVWLIELSNRFLYLMMHQCTFDDCPCVCVCVPIFHAKLLGPNTRGNPGTGGKFALWLKFVLSRPRGVN